MKYVYKNIFKWTHEVIFTGLFILLVASVSNCSIHSRMFQAVDYEYTWIVEISPWFSFTIFILFLVLFYIVDKLKAKCLILFFMVLLTTVTVSLPNVLYNYGIREIQLEKELSTEKLIALEEKFKIKSYQYKITDKDFVLIYSKRNYSLEFEQSLK